MYRMVVIDDEKVERDGITRFIDWEQYDIRIVGDAWNGKEGAELIRREAPDIILTDIKMPIMDGIEMIRQEGKNFPDSVFVVLSGYGDYEYTSQAMLLGVKYYILKPCDEEGLVKVLSQVKREIDAKRRERLFENEQYDNDVKRLLPRAKVQFFKSALSNKYLPREELDFYRKFCSLEGGKLMLLVFRGDPSEQGLSAFVVENIFEELMNSDEIIMKTELESDVVFLLRTKNTTKIQSVSLKVVDQFRKIFGMDLNFAMVKDGSLEDVCRMYEVARGRLGKAAQKLRQIIGQADLAGTWPVKNLDELLFNCHTAWVLFQMEQMTVQEMAEGFLMLLTRKYGGDERYQALRKCGTERELFEQVISLAREKSGLQPAEGEKRLERILMLIYEYLGDRRLSMQWLAKEVLYMNEDYLGRLFKINMKRRIPEYLNSLRMETAKQMLNYNRECPLEMLAYHTGYSEDGQYFLKVFKKHFGCTLSEYREKI